MDLYRGGKYSYNTYGATTYDLDWKVRSEWQWIPEQFYDEDTGTYVDNPNDLPTPMFYVRIRGTGDVSVQCLAGDNRVPGAEHTSVAIKLDETTSNKTAIQTVNAHVVDPTSYGGVKYDGMTKEWLVPIWTGGQDRVYSPYIIAKLQGKVDERTHTEQNYGGRGGPQTYPTASRVWDGYHARFQWVDLSLYISSDIETSWKKSVGLLPEIYEEKNSDGSWRYGHEQVAGQNTPGNTSDDVWKLECIRNADGSMTVESVARLAVDKSSTATPQKYVWMQTGLLQANQNGFATPQYSWDVPGFGPAPTPPVTSNPTTPPSWNSADTSRNLANSWLILGQSGSTALPSTTSTVTVREDSPDPSAGNVELSNNYTVNWHTTFEKQSNVAGYPRTLRQEFQTLAGPDDAWLDAPLEATGMTDSLSAKYFLRGVEIGLTENPASGVIDLIKTIDEIKADPYLVNVKDFRMSSSSAWGQAYVLDQGHLIGSSQPFDPQKSYRIPSEITQYQNWKTEGYQLCKVEALMIQYIDQKRWLADRFDKHGFHSPNNELGSDIISLAQIEPQFTFDASRAVTAGRKLNPT